MRQKFFISRTIKSNDLKIMEYAVLGKNLKNVSSENLRTDNFSLLGEEKYENAKVVDSISRGDDALVGMLRTHNIFPIHPYACKIAEAIRELYGRQENAAVELFFDDMDLIAFEKDEEPEEELESEK